MNTPICDFAARYAQSGTARLHMPGHKGQPLLGMEHLDITEIAGADSLYEADGIIAQSEENAAQLFGTRRTFYSTEGSSQCIRAMLHLAVVHRAKDAGCTVLAGRNAHKTFLFAAAAIGFDVMWMAGERADDGLCGCTLSPETVQAHLRALPVRPAAVYITSPDYLGGMADIAGIAAVCHRFGVPLLVDNAHGAYLKFLPQSMHPMDLGADMCCDSAHKTLPALAGAAYLHMSENSPAVWTAHARDALALYGSTSPSYLILQSLDAVNAYIADGYAEKLAAFCAELRNAKKTLAQNGWTVRESDPLKCTIVAPEGTTGSALSAHLRENGCECEFADADFLVLMLTPSNPIGDLERLVRALGTNRAPARVFPSAAQTLPEAVLSPREAIYAPSETVPISAACGRICAMPTVACPPAVPIVAAGERIDSETVERLARYGVKSVRVCL